jgi:hypothetical protein
MNNEEKVYARGYTTHRSKLIGVYKDGVRVAVYTTMSNAARDLDIAVQNIHKALNGYKTTLKGYEFRIEEEV